MSDPSPIDQSMVESENRRRFRALERDAASRGDRLSRRGLDLEAVVRRAERFEVAVPSWRVGTGGTRFARFPGIGEPRTIEEKLHDCAVIQQLGRVTPAVSLHIPWDRPASPAALVALAGDLGLRFDAINSNTFQDQTDQPHSYKFGSLTHTDAAVRRQAVAHNIECIEIGRALGSRALSIWSADGGNLPGQQHVRHALDRFLESVRAIYVALPADWQVFLEHKLYEPAFYSTVINDWGVSYWAARELGPQAKCLVDLGHHAPNVNIEMVVARLIQFGKLAGFHFNDSQYGDDDLDAGSITPFRLFLIFNELIDAEQAGVPGFDPVYMLDQSHNVTDPIESLMASAAEVQRAYVKASLVDRAALGAYQDANDAIMALGTLKDAFNEDVSAILALARLRMGGAIDPIATYRASGYRAAKGRERGDRLEM